MTLSRKQRPAPAIQSSSQLSREKLQQLYAVLSRYRAMAGDSAAKYEAVHTATGIDLMPGDFLVYERKGEPRYLAVKDLTVVPDADAQIATGLALGVKLERSGRVVLSFAHTPAAESKAALRFGFEHKLPIVYVTLDAALTEQPISNSVYGFPVMAVDENDVVALYRVAQEAIYRARNGQGPTLLACSAGAEQDAVEYMRRYLEKKGL